MTGTAEASLALALHLRGGRVTPQRRAIARLIDEAQMHVTAEEIYSQVSERLPGVSIPTVYATLELLEELGHVARVPTSSGPALFDTRTDEHHHMICRACGHVADLMASVDRERLVSAAGAHGFHAEQVQLVVQGLCDECAAAPVS